jgi:hypothetical protein
MIDMRKAIDSATAIRYNVKIGFFNYGFNFLLFLTLAD